MLSMIAALAAAASPAPAEMQAIYKAAGATRRGAKWVMCAEEPDAQGLRVELYRDLNGDGRPEAIIAEDGSFCYGATGAGYAVLTREVSGAWRKMDSGAGIVEPLTTRGAGGYPDLSIGGPGFCFPVVRWNGRAYANQRFEYEGKPCRPGR